MSYQSSVGCISVGFESRLIPDARSGHSLVSQNKSRCLLFGGYDGKKCFNDLHVLDFENEMSSGTWAEIDPLREDENRPAARASHTACDCENQGMFICGGSGEQFGFTNLGDVYFYDYAESKWFNLSHQGLLKARGKTLLGPECLPNMPHGRSLSDFEIGSKPSFGYGRASVYEPSTGIVYVFGGTDGVNYTNDVWWFHLNTGVWARVRRSTGEKPAPRYLSKLALTQGGFIVVGGSMPPFCFRSHPMQMYHFDMTKMLWSETKQSSVDLGIASWPGSRLAHAMTQLDHDNLFIFGGSCRDSDASTSTRTNPGNGNIRSYPDCHIYDDAWIFCISSNQWKRIHDVSNAPGSLDFLAAASLRQGRDVVVYGGFTGNARTSRAFRFRLRHQVPTLEEACIKLLQAKKAESPHAFPLPEEWEGILPEHVVNSVYN